MHCAMQQIMYLKLTTIVKVAIYLDCVVSFHIIDGTRSVVNWARLQLYPNGSGNWKWWLKVYARGMGVCQTNVPVKITFSILKHSSHIAIEAFVIIKLAKLVSEKSYRQCGVSERWWARCVSRVKNRNRGGMRLATFMSLPSMKLKRHFALVWKGNLYMWLQ